MNAMNNMDKYGLLVQPVDNLTTGQDGGDSMRWTATYLYLSEASNIKYFNEMFESKKYPGLYIRHPDPEYSGHGFASYCSGNWSGVESRDQMTGKLALFALTGSRKSLWRSFKMHLKRGLLFANNTIKNGEDPIYAKWKFPDITFFDIWSMYIRGFRSRLCWPLLLVFDLHLLGAAVINRNRFNTDPISYIDKCIVACSIMPTPWVWFINRLNKKKKATEELTHYWGGWRSHPGMPMLYKKYLNKYWRG